LGGVENFDEADALKPCEFSNEAVRKARYLNLFQQYEDEIVRLNKYIDSLNADITKLKVLINLKKINFTSFLFTYDKI
jgi:hypothetical protein